jgi:hypothetical protein
MAMADEELPLVPGVPETLREAAQLGKLIPFVGAGVSLLAGCPGWGQFADGALRCFVDRGKFSNAQLDQIRGLNPRVRLSIALGLQEELKLKIDFRQLLHPVERKDHRKGRHVYSLLSRIGRTFVTTNYDEWLDDEIGPPPVSVTSDSAAVAKTDAITKAREVFFEPVDLSAANLNRDHTVLHLHGSLRKPEGMIITTLQYIKHYRNDRRSDSENPVLTFLEDLFSNKTVLFIGYGLEELEILEYVILKSRDFTTPGVEPRHFMLQGFFSHERELMIAMRRYYRECGIELLPFRKDEKGWDQLVDVLDELGRTIPASSLAVLEELDEMEKLLA